MADEPHDAAEETPAADHEPAPPAEAPVPSETPPVAEEAPAEVTAPADASAPREAPSHAEPVAAAPEPAAEQTPAEQPPHAVPTPEAATIAGSVEDAPLEALEEARDASLAGDSGPAGDPAPSSDPDSSEPAPSAPIAADGATGAEEELEEDDEEEPAPRVKPAVPGAHLEVDIVPEGVDPLGRDVVEDPYALDDDEPEATSENELEEEEPLAEPISTAAIDLAAGARYRATGKRKTAIARVILRPGSGTYKINGRTLAEYFPRETLQRNIRQPLETVGYQERMDVVARLHGGGISAQAGALRHGVSRALLEADPNLRGELKRRGFLTRDSRAKERKKAGLKKARKRPQFSKR